VPPLLAEIEHDVGLNGAAAGLLTALPVACMGAFAPLAHRLALRLGTEAAVLGAVALLTAGVALRGAGGSVPVLYGSTLVAGAGIAVCSALLPGILKTFFPTRPGLMTGVYLTAMMFGAAVAAGTAVPLQRLLGSWEAALAAWAVVGVAGTLAWWPVVARRNTHERDATRRSHGLPWRSRTAWLVTVYLSLQSVVFYAQLAWIPPAYRAVGWSAEDSGLLLSVFTMVQVVSSMAVPSLAERSRDRRPWFFAVVGCTTCAVAVLLVAPAFLPWLVVAALGFGLGGAFALGLLLLVDHAHDADAAGRLSAMAFLVSYLVAAVGPTLVGALRDLTGGFATGWAVLLALCLVQLGVCAAFTPGRRDAGV
jgi:CP family cyanate transporter-like MFS transporter